MIEDNAEVVEQTLDHETFRGLLGDMTSSFSTVRETVKKLSAQ